MFVNRRSRPSLSRVKRILRTRRLSERQDVHLEEYGELRLLSLPFFGAFGSARRLRGGKAGPFELRVALGALQLKLPAAT